MAQTSSVTREPSMEEILASIRRIIEDSDVSKQASAELTGTAVAKPRPEMFNAVHEELEEKRGEVAAFPRPVLKEVETENQASIAAQQSPFAMKAALRGTLDETQNNVQPEENSAIHAEIHQRNVEQVRIATVNPPLPPVVQAVAPVAAPLPTEQELKTTKASEALLLHVAEKRVVMMNAQNTKQEAAPVPEPISEPAATKPLISQAAEEQVSASFGSLSQALLEEQKRLLDEKMEAMLRPMLQQWLDTNLPPLVERLVREEIERVVRRG